MLEYNWAIKDTSDRAPWQIFFCHHTQNVVDGIKGPFLNYDIIGRTSTFKIYRENIFKMVFQACQIMSKELQ